MELYCCGINNAGNLDLPIDCIRYHIDRRNPCDHEVQLSDGRSYCGRMVLQPARIRSAASIRMINADLNSSFLDIDGKLEILGLELDHRNKRDPPPAEQIVQFFELRGMRKLGFYTLDGDIWTVDYLKNGEKELIKHEPASGRLIRHLCFGGHSDATCIVSDHEPYIVLFFDTFNDCLSWFVGTANIREPEEIHLPGPVEQLVGNFSAFTARLKSGEVYTRDAKMPKPPKTIPASTNQKHDTDALSETGCQQSSSTSLIPEPNEDEDEEEEDGPDMSAIIDGLSTLASQPPQIPAPRSSFTKLPVPPSMHLSASHLATGSISTSGLHLWRDPSRDHPSYPRIQTLGTPDQPTLQDFTASEGNRLQIVDVAISPSHIVALASSGEVFSAGQGWYGELGIGERSFELRVGDGFLEGEVEFAERWQRVDLSRLGKGMQVRKVAAWEGTTFLVAEHIN